MSCGQDRELFSHREVSLSHRQQTHFKPPSSTEDGKGCMTQPLANLCMLGDRGRHREYALRGKQQHMKYYAESDSVACVRMAQWPLCQGRKMENTNSHKMVGPEENLDLPEVGKEKEYSKEGHQDEWRLISKNVLSGCKNSQLGRIREFWAISLGEGKHGY